MVSSRSGIEKSPGTAHAHCCPKARLMNQPAFTRMYSCFPQSSPTVSKIPVLSLRRIVITTDHRDNVISVQGTPRRDVRREVENFGSVNTAINEAAVEDLRGQRIVSRSCKPVRTASASTPSGCTSPPPSCRQISPCEPQQTRLRSGRCF